MHVVINVVAAHQHVRCLISPVSALSQGPYCNHRLVPLTRDGQPLQRVVAKKGHQAPKLSDKRVGSNAGTETWRIPSSSFLHRCRRKKAIGKDIISAGSSFPSGGLIIIIIGFEQTYPGEPLIRQCAPAFILATRLFRFVCSLTRNPAILTDGCWCSARTPFISDPCLQSSRPVVQWDPSCSINATEVFPSLVSSTRGARLCLYG